MRLKQLIIDAFGHFSGKVFDFGAPRGGCDFHIIYGHNEAGKTTLMAAYLRLLYGIGKNEPYAFFHNGRKNLKISAVLEENGESRFISRAPQGNSSVLKDENGKIIAQVELETYLRGTNLQQYKNLLCLDDETIEAGGNEILKAEGDMGALLFSAGSGMSDFSAKLRALEKETDELYKQRKQKTEFAELKRRYQQLEDEIRDKDIRSSEYEELLSAAAGLDEEASRAAQARRAADDIYEQLKALAAAQAETEKYQKELRAVCAELARLRAELGFEAVAPRADAAESYQRLADFALTEAQLEQLDSLREQAQKAQQEYEAAEDDMTDLRAKAETAERQMSEFAAALPAPETASMLAALIGECEEHNMPAALQTAKAQAADEAKRYEAALAALSLGGQIFTAPPSKAPRAAEIEALARAEEKQSDALKQLREELRDNEAELQIITQKAEQARQISAGAVL